MANLTAEQVAAMREDLLRTAHAIADSAPIWRLRDVRACMSRRRLRERAVTCAETLVAALSGGHHYADARLAVWAPQIPATARPLEWPRYRARIAQWRAEHAAQVALLDRLIARHGPDCPVREVLEALAREALARDAERPEAERQDHVVGADAPIVDGAHEDAAAEAHGGEAHSGEAHSGEAHGGDGNSSECDHTADTRADAREGGVLSVTNATHGRGTEAGEDGRSDAAAETPRDPSDTGDSSTGRGASGADEVTPGMDSQPSGHSPRSDDGVVTLDADRSATGCEADALTDTAEGTGSGDADSPAPYAPDEGKEPVEYGAPSGAMPETVVSDDRAVARATAALRELVDRIGAPSQRITRGYDARRLVRELVSRRCALQRARRVEALPRRLLVLPDLSGSCAHVGEVLLGLARAMAARDRRIIVAPSGYWAAEGIVHARALEGASADALRPVIERLGGAAHSTAHWARLRAAGVSHVLALGDVHGAVSYANAAHAGVRVLWVDPNPGMMPHGFEARNCSYFPARVHQRADSHTALHAIATGISMTARDL